MISFYYFIITKTVSSLLKSTAGFIIAYLSITFFVFSILLTVPIIIPFGYIPPIPDVSTVSFSSISAPVDMYVAFNEFVDIAPLQMALSPVDSNITLTALDGSIIVVHL